MNEHSMFGLVHFSLSSQQSKSDSLIFYISLFLLGVRLYFSLCRFGTLNGRPSQISLVHVRLPPRVTEGIQTVKPDNAKQVYSKQGEINKKIKTMYKLTHLFINFSSKCFCLFSAAGTLLLSCSESDDADLLWVVSPDSYPFTKVLMETFVSLASHHFVIYLF